MTNVVPQFFIYLFSRTVVIKLVL